MPTLDEIRERLLSRIAETAGLDSVQVDMREPFANFGLASKDAVALSGELEEWLGRKLSPTLFYNYPNIVALAEYLAGLTQDQKNNWKMSGSVLTIEAEPLAIISMACRFPGADNPESFWRLLREGGDAVTEIPVSRWNLDDYYAPQGGTPGKMYTRWGGFLEDIDLFDSGFFNISPREAEQMDPQQRIMLELFWEALENAAIVPKSLAGSTTGVFIGHANCDYLRLQRDLSALDAYSGTGSSASIVANRLSYLFDLRGPSLTVDTACSSSLVAVHLACQSLRNHESDLALAGGVNVILLPDANISFSHAHMMSPDGRCRTFDGGANGYVRGEGAGLVLLKRFSDALRDGDRILALVRGTAINQDGHSNGLTAPNGVAQEAVIRQALQNAGVMSSQIGYVEAHGTGTPLGDPIEFEALKAVLMPGRSPEQTCLLGSVKTNIGHLEAAAGIAGLIKVVLSLHHGEVPRLVHLKNLSPHINLEGTSFELPHHHTSWPKKQKRRIAGVSSFGFGGTNAHAIVEAAPVEDESGPGIERPFHLFTFSARSEESLRMMAARYREFFTAHPEISIGDACYTAATGRPHFDYRVAISTPNLDGLCQKLATFTDSHFITNLQTQARQKPGIAFLFTGQGSQYVGMGQQLYQTQPVFRRTLDRCEAILRQHMEQPLLSVLFAESQRGLLDETAFTQPALFVLEYALAELWRSWGIEPHAVMGHSVGEYTAACVAGVFGLEDGLRLIAARARLMHALPRNGAMAAIHTDINKVTAAIAFSANEISVAAVNGPQSVVISGQASAIEAAIAAFEAEGIKAQRLTVSHAFHSQLMEPMLEDFRQVIQDIRFSCPRVPMVSNVTGQTFLPGQAPDAVYWIRHVRETVQFYAGMKALHAMGTTAYMEMGPDATLVGMGRQCLPAETVAWLFSLRKRNNDWQQMLQSLGSLYQLNADIDWTGFDRDYSRRRISLPTYAFHRKRYWIAPATAHSSSGIANLKQLPEVHPLLGHRLRSALPGAQFDKEFVDQALAYLADHRLYEAAILPASSYLEMALAAGAEFLGSKVKLPAVKEVVIHQPLFLSRTNTQTVQTILTPGETGAATFQVFSLQSTAATERDCWTLHAQGKVLTSRQVFSGGSNISDQLLNIKERCKLSMAPNEFYAALRNQGLDYGPAFRGIEQLWCGLGEALGRIHVPAHLQNQGRYLVHPSLLDSGFQLFAAALMEHGVQSGRMELCVPVGMEEMQWQEIPGNTIWCHASLRSATVSPEKSILGDLRMFDENGVTLAVVRGLQLKRVTPKKLLANHRPPVQEDFYEIVWRNRPLEEQGPLAAGQDCLIFADPVDMAERMSLQIRECGARCYFVHPSESAMNDGAEYRINPERAEDYEWLLNRVVENKLRVRHVILMWGVNPGAAEKIEAAEFNLVQDSQCVSLLYLVQALARNRWPVMPRLSLVTQGALPGIAHSVSGAIAFSPIWGMAKVIALEHPELRCLRIDLDSGTEKDQAELLLKEIYAESNEDQVAFRDGQRYVARLVHSTVQNHRPAFDQSAGHPVRLQISARGRIDNLFLEAATRQFPGSGQVEIEIYASGLNFRDVVGALGLYPGEPGPMGSECAGRVVAVGPNVRELSPGDEVVAIAPGTFSSYVTTDADLVVSKPATLTYVEAATVPIVFLTAQYALQTVAGISAGDRVLIHAAAGGVGLAALQLAQRAGAEVFATAGSLEKREFLRSLGVTHIMNSRSLSFADEVMKLTGGRGVDIVLNSLSGDYIAKSFSVLAHGGRFLEIGKIGIWDKEQVSGQRPDVSYRVIDLAELCLDQPALIREMLTGLMADFMRGSLKPLPRRVFSLEDAAGAFRYMAQAKHIGKIVIVQNRDVAKDHKPEVEFRADGTYLITGGLGALGLMVARWMVERGARNLVLVGRNRPSEEAQKALKEMEEAGARVSVALADITVPEQIERVINDQKMNLPRLRGVIYAAGVLADSPLLKQDRSQLISIMAPKVAGAWNLHRLTNYEELDFFVLFSSAASVLGSLGQAAYAAANAFQDALAHYRRERGLPAVSINWGPWEGLGMTSSLDPYVTQRWKALGVEPIIGDHGLQALGNILASGHTQIAVLPGPWPHISGGIVKSSQWPFLAELAGINMQPETDVHESSAKLALLLKEAAPAQRRQILLDYIRGLLAGILGLEQTHKIDPQQPLNELGVDSLMAIEIKNALSDAMGSSLPSTLVFEYPTLEFLAAHLASTVGGQETASMSPVQEQKREDLDSILAGIESMSDAEAEALLSESAGASGN